MATYDVLVGPAGGFAVAMLRVEAPSHPEAYFKAGVYAMVNMGIVAEDYVVLECSIVEDRRDRWRVPGYAGLIDEQTQIGR